MDRKRLTILGLVVICLFAITTATFLFIVAINVIEIEGIEGNGLVNPFREENSGVSVGSRDLDIEEITAGPTNNLTPFDSLEASAVVSGTPPATTAPNLDGELGASDLDSITHAVQSDENIFQLSVRYGVSMDAIMEANDILDPRAISVGQLPKILTVPESQQSTPRVNLPGDLLLTLTATVDSSPTATATSTSTATPEVTLMPPPNVLNGVNMESIIVMPPGVRNNVREIYARGQEFELNPRAYSKVGDSTIESPYLQGRFDEGPYNLGEFSYLQTVVDYYAGSHERQGQAVRVVFHSWTVTDPLWADKEACLPNETPVACEIRLHRPSIIIIRLGSNDAGVPGSFDFNVRQVVEYAIQQGVIPVIGTKADRFEGPGNANNIILRQIAADFQIPLWDFDVIAATIPGRGLDIDDVHLTTFYAHDYTSPVAFERGHGIHNLTALMMLDAVRREVATNSG